MPVTYIPLATQTLGSAAASVTFSSIPGTYTDLRLVISGTIPTAIDPITINVNSDTASNYSYTLLYGDGTSAASTRSSNLTAFRAGYLGTVQGITSVDFLNYSNTTTNKTMIGRGSVANWGVTAQVSMWRSTAAITSMTIQSLTAYNFAAGSTFSLYGIASTAVGAKATGGTIFKDSNYYYHAFTSSGTFTPTQSLSADILVVAGGGGGGGAYAGGGGAGGLLGFTSQSLTATGYTITVGAGGAGGAQNVSGTTGSDSQFGALTLVKGGGGGGNGGATATNIGLNGGSGGGGGRNAFLTPADAAGGSATSGQGFAGGTYVHATSGNVGAGGGGSGAAGGSQTSAGNVGGVGGVGLSTYSSWGLATGTGQNVSGTVYYAGGGGGGAFTAATAAGTGGYGGGANGGYGVSGASGTANTGGGGGGGGGNTSYAGGTGGSGLVIVRYPV